MSQDRAATWKGLFYALLFFTIILIMMVLYLQVQLHKEEIKVEAYMKMVTITVEQLGYSISTSNITIEEFGEKFLRFKLEEIIQEGKDE